MSHVGRIYFKLNFKIMKTKTIIFSVGIIIALVLVIMFLRRETEPIVKTDNVFPYSSSVGTIAESSSPIQGILTLLDKPLLNVPVRLVFSFKSTAPAPNTIAKIELPDGFELVSGTPAWSGDIVANEEHKIEIVVKSTKTGYYQLIGSAISNQGESSYFGDTAMINIEISTDNAILESTPKNNWHDSDRIQAGSFPKNNGQIESELILSNIPELNNEFTVTFRATPLIKLPSERTYFNLVFPAKAFKLINVQFPQNGETYERDNQLSWVGNINTNQTVEIVATFKVIDVGWGDVYGSLNSQSGTGGSGVSDFITDVKTASIYVDQYGGKFTIE